MVFSSALFLVLFLPVFLLVYYITPQRGKNLVALVGSVAFYAWGAPVFALLLLASGALDYWVSARLTNNTRTKSWLIFGVTYNLFTLLVFKYFNFFMDNAATMAAVLGFAFPAYMKIALPIGISFFTFQKISYLVDVYRGDTNRARTLPEYWLFVFLFPQLIAGPIIRYKDLALQITDRFSAANWTNRLSGMYRFILGLAKKILIADALAPFAEQALETPELSAPTAWLTLLAYAMQIYFDFSAYSDMAIGLGKMMDFEFPENFNWPYISKGFQEFWRRWHITLSTWMRDYLYVPLGGSHGAASRTVFNLWVVFLLSGFWHGASWNFVIWGAWHGLFISLDRFTGLFRKTPSLVSVPLTFLLATLGWVWFQAEDLGEAVQYMGSLFTGSHAQAIWPGARQTTVLVIALVFAFIPPSLQTRLTASVQSNNSATDILKSALAVLLLFLCLGQLAVSEGQPFIYFRF